MWNFAIANCDLPESFVYAVVDVVMSDNERMVNIHRAARSTLPENWDKNGVLMWHPGAARGSGKCRRRHPRRHDPRRHVRRSLKRGAHGRADRRRARPNPFARRRAFRQA
jgi:hypothetical protein